MKFLSISLLLLLSLTLSKRTLAEVNESVDDEKELKSFDEFVVGKSLMRGEIKELFRTVDKHRDNNIGASEWAEFNTLFIAPYENECKPDSNYLVSHQNLADCILKSTYFSPLRDFMMLNEKGVKAVAMGIIDSLGSDMNFNDYVHLRKAQVAWQQCSDSNGLASIKFQCGIQIVLSGGLSVSEFDMSSVFDTAILVSKGRLMNPLYLDFVSFYITSKEYMTYVDFDRPVFSHAISYTEFMKGIDWQLFPIFLPKIDIDFMWELFGEKMDANGFLVFYDTYNLFEKYDEDNNRRLEEKEFLKFLDDKAFDPIVLKNIDSFVLPSLQQVQDEITKSSPDSLNDKTFILNFLQSSSSLRKSKTWKIKLSDVKGNLDFTSKDKLVNRKLIFNLLDVRNRKGITLKHLILFRLITWAFAYFDTNFNGYINSEEIKAGLKQFLPPIPFTKDTSVAFNELMVFLTHIYNVNIKQFLSFFLYKDMFDMWKIPNTFDVSLDNLKILTKKMGLPFSVANVGEAKETFNANARQMYNYRIAFMKLMKDEVKTLREMRLSNVPGVNYETLAFGGTK